MAQNRLLTRQPADTLKELFEKTVTTILRSIGARAFRPKSAVNAAVLDSIMVGVATAVESGNLTSDANIKSAYAQLLLDQDYIDSTTRATADEESIRTRLRLARSAFISSE